MSAKQITHLTDGSCCPGGHVSTQTPPNLVSTAAEIPAMTKQPTAGACEAWFTEHGTTNLDEQYEIDPWMLIAKAREWDAERHQLRLSNALALKKLLEQDAEIGRSQHEIASLKAALKTAIDGINHWHPQCEKASSCYCRLIVIPARAALEAAGGEW